MRFEDFIYALNDYPKIVEEAVKAIDNSYDNFYQEILSYGKAKIINFGENIHAHLLSEKYLEKYLIPFYEKRVNQLKRGEIYTHIHIDGYLLMGLRH